MHKDPKQLIQKSKVILHKNYQIILVLLFSLITKLVLILPDKIPFAFDHGKDSVAVLHMIKTFTPKLIGPWTSIPGLFFGPGWYYFLAPWFIFGFGHPIAPVIGMIFLNLIIIYLMNKHFGWIEAVIVACTQGWIMISISAWNPYPIALLMLLIIINLKPKKLSLKNISIIFFSASLSFHFSSAFAISYFITLPTIIGYYWFRKKINFNFKLLITAIISFGIPFLPQILFELRHQFLQTNAVIDYLKSPPPEQIKFTINQIIQSFIGTIQLTIFPRWEFAQFDQALTIISIIFFIFSLILIIRNRKQITFSVEALIFISVPIYIFSKIHFNHWYLVSTMPILVIIAGQLIRNLPKWAITMFMILFFLSPIAKIYRLYKVDLYALQSSNQFLPVKFKAISEIRKRAGGQPFSSYHYLPDIYDYAYQYIYLWQGFQGQPLPVEFSYKPGEINYIPEKAELLEQLSQPSQKPKYIFYLVTKEANEEHLQKYLELWWQQQKFDKIIDEVQISDDLTLYQALP